MKKDRDFSRLFAKGQELETSLTTSSIFSKDGGLHLTSYRVEVDGKVTVIDNLSVYGKTVVVIESKNYTELQGDVSRAFWKGRGVKTYFSIPSPLLQNKYHVKILAKYLLTHGLRIEEFKIEHYIVVPDKCQVDVCEVVRDNLLFQSELTTLKRRLAFYNKEPNLKLEKIIKGGLF